MSGEEVTARLAAIIAEAEARRRRRRFPALSRDLSGDPLEELLADLRQLEWELSLEREPA